VIGDELPQTQSGISGHLGMPELGEQAAKEWTYPASAQNFSA
jgi:hypothetical protein